MSVHLHYDCRPDPFLRVTTSDAQLGGSRRRLMVAYGFGDAGTGLAATILGFYLFPFFTCAAGLPAFIAGSLLPVITVSDAFTEPHIGGMSDHTQSRWGPRLPWMLGASLPLGISLAAMWWVPEGTLMQRTIYYVVMAILLMTAYTGVNLPYAALSTELTADTAIRARWSAARFTGTSWAGTMGLLVAVLVRRGDGGGGILRGQRGGTIAGSTTGRGGGGVARGAEPAHRSSRGDRPGAVPLLAPQPSALSRPWRLESRRQRWRPASAAMLNASKSRVEMPAGT